MPWDHSILFCIATMVVVFAASLEHLLKIPDVNVFSGQEFKVKLNFTSKEALPEEVSFVKLRNISGQLNIEIMFLYYHKHTGLMSGSVHDPRISFIGDLSSGQPWLRFLDVNVNDSGTYGVLYKRPKNTEIFESVFELNVTQASNTAKTPNTDSEGNTINPREKQESTLITQVRATNHGSASASQGTGTGLLLLAVVASTLI